MKPHKSIGAYVAVLLIAVCSATDSATMASFQNASVEKAVTGGTFNCRKANAYRLVVVPNPDRKRSADPVAPEDVNIVVGDKVISKIELPNEAQAKNFSLNAIKKHKAGFEINVDWGSGIDHYEIQFNFRCQKSKFYLSRIVKVSFSTTDRDSGNFLDKKDVKVTRFRPNLPLEKFVMLDYL